MTSGLIAALVTVLLLGFVEGLRRFYPSLRTWRRLRSSHGRRAVRAMRERFEAASLNKTPRVLAVLMLALVIAWVAASGLLDKKWYEVLTDTLPYVFAGVALLRTPGALRAVAARMRGYESDLGEDPDEPLDDGTSQGPTALAL